MNANVLYLCGVIAGALPFLAIAVILIHYALRRVAWKVKRRRGDKNLGFYPSVAALGMAFLFVQMFIRPSLQSLIAQTKEVEEHCEDDEEEDPQRGEKALSHQLKRLRRGEPVDQLTVRL